MTSSWSTTERRNLKDLAIVPAGDKPLRVPVKSGAPARSGRWNRRGAAGDPVRSQPPRRRSSWLSERPPRCSDGRRTTGLAPLPGTRREVQAIAALFPNDRVTTLLGRDATESNLQRLAESGALKNYRFLHLATHGEANRDRGPELGDLPGRRARRPSASAAAARRRAADGRITAEQIVRTWDLDADLVVLSACESGLGRYAGGEGYLGFAQALFVKGARSLVLSHWKVDDTATALLMERFYQNLLGKRPGLSQPMPKAEALDEAKHWLRSLGAGKEPRSTPNSPRSKRGGGPLPLAKVDGPAPLRRPHQDRPTPGHTPTLTTGPHLY